MLIKSALTKEQRVHIRSTVKQERIKGSFKDRLDEIVAYCTPEPRSPAEISAHIGYSYPPAAIYPLNILIKQGRITRIKRGQYQTVRTSFVPESKVKDYGLTSLQDRYLVELEVDAREFIWDQPGDVATIKSFVAWSKSKRTPIA